MIFSALPEIGLRTSQIKHTSMFVTALDPIPIPRAFK